MGNSLRDRDYQRHNHATYERTDGSRERHQRQHRNRSRDRDHEQHRGNSYDRYQYGSNEEHRKDRKRDRLASGAAGYQTPWQELKKGNALASHHSQHLNETDHSRSHHQSRAEQRHTGARERRVGASDPLPRQQRGPDGDYDAGYRSRGIIEKTLCEARKKRQRQTRTMNHDWNREETSRNNKVRKQPEIDKRDKRRIKVYEWKPRAIEAEALGRHHQSQKDRGRMGQDGEQRWRVVGQKSRGASVPVIRIRPASPVGSPERTIPPGYRTRTVPKPSGRQKSQVRSKRDMSQSGATSCDYQRSQEAPIPRDHDYEDNHHGYRPTYPQSITFDDPQRHGIASSYVDNQSSVKSEIASRAEPPIMSHAPSPPPPPPVLRAASNGRAALLDSIQGRIEQLRIANPNKKDKSAGSTVGGVLYEQTEHSQEVEERERAQAKGSTDGQDPHPEPNRAFRQDLLDALQRRNTT
ncbi:hypothetical protein J3E73DRAFT_410709 [Bipolaris maydis]|nr:hypothetical protein J3E73DRAFT_410709 [Bipolaris maydis]